MNSPMHDAAAERFGRACIELERISLINSTGVNVCVDAYRQYGDKEASDLLAQSLALACAQIHHGHRELPLLTVECEMAAAKQLS